MKLWQDELFHFVPALAIGLALAFYYQGWWLVGVSLSFGFLIDADHFYDFFRHYKSNFRLKKFFDPCAYLKPSGKIYVLLHGWEYVIAFWILGRLLGMPGLEWAMSLPYLAHLLWDNISFPHHPLAYFLIYRWRHKFSQDAFKS